MKNFCTVSAPFSVQLVTLPLSIKGLQKPPPSMVQFCSPLRPLPITWELCRWFGFGIFLEFGAWGFAGFILSPCTRLHYIAPGCTNFERPYSNNQGRGLPPPTWAACLAPRRQRGRRGRSTGYRLEVGQIPTRSNKRPQA